MALYITHFGKYVNPTCFSPEMAFKPIHLTNKAKYAKLESRKVGAQMSPENMKALVVYLAIVLGALLLVSKVIGSLPPPPQWVKVGVAR
jgi:hypothetical protein